MSKVTTQDRSEFLAFCKNATDSQLREIIRKEKEAGRQVYQSIAETEAHIRGIDW